MTVTTPASLARLVALACLLAVGLLLPAAPAQAAERSVLLSSTADVVDVRVGDSVAVVNDTLSPHTVDGAWFGGRVELDAGERTTAVVLSRAGDYAFTDRTLLTVGDPRRVVVRATAPRPAPTAPPEDESPSAEQPDPAPSPTSTAAADRRAAEREQARAAERSAAERAAAEQAADKKKAAAKEERAAARAAATTTSASAATRSVGGSGVALAPSLGVGSMLPAPSLGSGPAPSVAPELGAVDPALLLSQGDPSLGVRGLEEAELQAVGLAGPPTERRLGLPVSVAVVALLGVASLVVRVLLAEPVRR